MSLLNAFAAARTEAAAAARKAKLARRPALDCLEGRKVLSTVAPSSGTFEGMAWSYSENASTHVGTLNFTSAPGSARIQIQPQHTDLSPGDPGYVANSNPVNGVTWTNNDDGGGVNITPGFHVNINVRENATDNQFVNNDKVDFTLNTSARPVSPTTPTPTPTPVGPTAPTAGVAQSGTTLGLAWRFAPDGSAGGGGTLYVQDVAKGTNAADRSNAPIAINQFNGHMVFDVDYSQPYYGPAVANNATVKVVLGATAGDINVYDDRGGSNKLRTVNRHQTGNMSMGQNSLAWTLDENVVTQQAVVNIQSNARDRSTYSISPTYLNLSPGDPGYVANVNPVTGLQVTGQGEYSGGVTVEQGMHIAVNTSGGATFRNYMPK